jgi:hypothetical protein
VGIDLYDMVKLIVQLVLAGIIRDRHHDEKQRQGAEPAEKFHSDFKIIQGILLMDDVSAKESGFDIT